MLNMLLDGLLIFLSYVVATYIRFDVMYGAEPALYIAWNAAFFRVAILYALAIVLLYSAARVYSSIRTRRISAIIGRILWVNVLGIVCITALLYFTRINDFSRLAFFIFLCLSTALVCLKHYAQYRLLRSMRNRGVNLKQVVLVGDGKLAHQYCQSIAENPQYGFQVWGYVSQREKLELGDRLCDYDGLEEWLNDHLDVDSVIIALDPGESGNMDRMIEACEKQGVPVSIIPYFHRYFPAQPTIDVVGNTKLINLRATPLDDALKAGGKRLFDVFFSLAVLLLTSPILLAAAIGTKLSSPGPIIFRQERVGMQRKPFVMYKFRSMRVNPREDTGWSKNEDPRKTRFGSFLRKCSIDELPQFWNVLKGDMSVIGPRPEVPHFVEQFKNEIPMYMLKHQVRPGITGWAQVCGYRGDTSIEKRIEHDLWYIENWSFGLDALILFKTAFGGMMNSEKIAPSAKA